MCNLYSITKNQAAIRDLFKVARDTTGNLPPLPAIFPDQMAPVVRVNEGERELTMMRWGMPNPPQHPGITTNIRNTGSPHWRRWLAPESRCLVPMSSFCEYAGTMPPKTPKWFAIDETRPLVAFAGIWTEWNGVRGTKANPVEGKHLLYGFLTTVPNGVVAPIRESVTVHDAVSRATPRSTMQVALAWLLRRAPNVLLIPGTCDFPYTFQSL
jgi:putative SOS response-associated peptidase YedK